MLLYRYMVEEQFKIEKELLETILSDEIVEVRNISKNGSVLEIGVLLTAEEYLRVYINSLAKIGYQFEPDISSSKRLFFKKKDGQGIKLVLTQETK